MARRSARLQKQPTPVRDTPSKSDDESWVTASPHAELPTLPELPDLPDPTVKTPQKPVVAERRPTSKLPPATATPTQRTNLSKSLLPAMSSRTPNNRTPIKPAGEEMHPAHHHASTAKVLDEARWLGFQALGAHTAPPKAMGANQATPSKTPVPASAADLTRIESSPDFRFRFKSPFSGFGGAKTSKQNGQMLSPRTRNLLKEVKGGDTPGGSRALFGATEFSSKADVAPERKKVEPKGKMARFSDVHMQQFKKMDSIANHPSAFRADPTRFKPVVAQPLKKSASKADLAKPEAGKLKRTQSKMDVAEPAQAPTSSLKRTQSKVDLTEPSTSKIPPTPLKRTQSKMDLTGSSLPRSQSTVRLVPSTCDGRPISRDGPTDGNPAAKRVKRTEIDDAATTRPMSRDGLAGPSAPVSATPARKITSQTALPRLAARLMTPTKSSIARSQSVKVMKTTSMIPSLNKSPSKSNLFSPTNIAQAMRDGAKESMRQASHNLQRVRSILRTPSRKFSDDPAKVAAGTHMSPPPVFNLEKTLPAPPATAPVKKQVIFSSSTLQRASETELGKSPSPMKFRAGSEVPSGAVFYPTLAGVQYPDISQDSESPTASPSRRLTFGGEAANHPRSFSFESGKAVNFAGPASTGTIRVVRKSDASSLVEGKKRKLDTVQESSDKENSEPAEDEYRSAKKVKPTPATPSKTPAASSKLPRRTPGRSSAISKLTRFVQQSSASDIIDFVTRPRFDDPAYLTTLAAALAAVFITMSWFSRSGGGGWGGRFSPFGRPGNSPNSGVVNDSDFSYITNEDLRRNGAAQTPEIVDWDDKNPQRETDVLVFKEKRTHYPTHFPAHSIRDGDLKIGTVRQAAAKKLGVADPRRIRMFFKGRNMKHDERSAREEGLRGDGTGSEILVTVGEAPVGGFAPGAEETSPRAWSDGEDEEDDDDDVDSGANTPGGKKKPRKRGGRKSKKKGAFSANASGTSTPGYVGQAAGSEYLPIPSHVNAQPRPTSAPPSNPPRAEPQSAMAKLEALASRFHTEFVPLAVQYINNPPEEKAKREFEYKKLSETILTQIIFKLDGVETEGDQEARMKRKAIVKEVQGMLNKLDEVGKAG
ncbi:hypothetical protein FB567DRAFT_500084 [Paraphoma chrysanthemicola]|uniref:BAG domain-containing protein n=1 Tax=Paraphoma chrysanthemicola TaxID=798071 RepID=A0A8K0R3I0_9PLEO|nr:hypothetical protein FB567DRAFT_500084 [Paraphoma chrysanthemicola]